MIHLKADTSIESHRTTTALHVVANQVPHHIGFFLYIAAYSNDLASTFWGYIKPCTPQLVHFYCVKVNNEAHSETRSCKEHAKHFNFFQERLGSTTTAMFPCVSVTEFNQHSINTAVTAWHTDWNKTHTHNQTHTHTHTHTLLLRRAAAAVCPLQQKSAISVHWEPRWSTFLSQPPKRSISSWFQGWMCVTNFVVMTCFKTPFIAWLTASLPAFHTSRLIYLSWVHTSTDTST